MNDASQERPDPGDEPIGDGIDTDLTEAGAALRRSGRSLPPDQVQIGALRRRARRRGLVASVAALVAVAAVAGAVLVDSGPAPGHRVAAGDVDAIVSSLDDRPVDPTKVRLVGAVRTFAGCDALIDDLRRVGAEHVGSRGFGASDTFDPVGAFVDETARATADSAAAVSEGVATGETLGTNVQVGGVDELDRVKTQGKWIYDFDGHGNLRITDATSLQITATVPIVDEPDPDDPDGPREALESLLVADGHVAVFGIRTVTADAVPGDPSATRPVTRQLTVVLVDATDPSAPKITDRVRIEGRLVSARLVEGQIRLVTTSDMDDLGFVAPTTPTSVTKALDANRRSVAASTVADWIPDWQRPDGDPEPLVPCARVHVPATFAGVAMTSLVSFPIDRARFAPEATSILAPGDTLYAGLEKVAVSSHVWVDPADRDRLHFDDWQTAVHEFHFAPQGAPEYVATGVVDGTTVGSFAFGEVGDHLGVVTTQGTPWEHDADTSVDLVLLQPHGETLDAVAEVADLAGGHGTVSAVRFVSDRVLVSTGAESRTVRVIDVSNPDAPRAAGSVTLAATTGYFHPLDDHRALLVGSRSDQAVVDEKEQWRPWVSVQILDVSDADRPRLSEAWEAPWLTDEVAGDHHAFTHWASRNLAMWGVSSVGPGVGPGPNRAVVLEVGGAPTEVAMPEAAPPPESAPPCPRLDIDDPDLEARIGSETVVLLCADPDHETVDWPRYWCDPVPKALVEQYAPEPVDAETVHACHPAPLPTVARVLVVSGRPVLLTDQTLQALDPATFATEQVVAHPTRQFFVGPIVR